MLRGVMGDDNFMKLLKAIPDKYRSGNHQHRRFPQDRRGHSRAELNWFFIEWIESSGAPEFKMEYTVFRTQKAPDSA